MSTSVSSILGKVIAVKYPIIPIMRVAGKTAKLILGSGSSIRRQILAEMGYEDIVVATADLDERNIGDRSTASGAEALVTLLAHEKADAIMKKLRADADMWEGSILITSDQIIAFEGCVLEKPLNADEARGFLRGYSGKSCSTVGSIVLTRLPDEARVEGVDISTVHFNDIPEETIERLIAEGDVFYSAGALLVESPLMEPCVDRIDGSMDGVQGLSKSLLAKLLDSFPVD